MKPDISVIIPTIGSSRHLIPLLDSVFKQEGIAFFEVLLCVNGPAAGALEALKSSLSAYPGLIFISDEIKGVNRARNAGIQNSKSEILLFLDDDCELPHRKFLSEHLELHRKDPQLFATGGGYLLAAETGYFDDIYNHIQMQWLVAGADPQTLRSGHLLGGNFSVKRALIQKNDLEFDEKITYGGSEYEFFRNAHLKGLAIKTNPLDVIHHTHESLFSLTRKIYRQGRGKAFVDQKHGAFQGQAGGRPVSRYFHYVFWLGYYNFQKRPFFIFIHAVREWLGFFQSWRYRRLSGISDLIQEKKDKGDRF